MKILYGVQATGNGHITRARAMSAAFATTSVTVDYIFSGRDHNKFFDMDCFGNWQCYPGMTFTHKDGKISPLKTLVENNVLRLWKDIKTLDLSGYDAVITDFEPISAWAAKLSGKPSIGMGHQYAFKTDIPISGSSLLSRFIMRYFAPAQISLGLHWHHFGQNILPPIAESYSSSTPVNKQKIVVYLGFESTSKVISLLKPFENYDFYYYGEFERAESMGHIHLRPLSRTGFQKDVADAAGVICNAGFELASEALQQGKKLLVKPLHGQMEQLSNAEALELLDLGMVMDELDSSILKRWLDNWDARQIIYPDVAQAIVNWIIEGDWSDSCGLVTNLWEQVSSPHIKGFCTAPYRAL